MRLLKALSFIVLGYVVYEFWQGVRSPGGRAGGNGGQSRRDLDRAMNRDAGRMANLTGTGRGTMVSTNDTDGMSAAHVVGRGVLHNS